MRKIRRWLRAIVMGLFALAGAQLPKISQDYQRQFSVRCNEISAQMQKVRSRALGLDETPSEYIRKHFLASPDKEVAYQGQLMQENWNRFELMTGQLERSQTKRDWLQPLYWFLHQDFAISRDTWKTYEVGFIYTSATLVWAFAGGALGLLLLGLAHLLYKQLLNLAMRAIGAMRRSLTGRPKPLSEDIETKEVKKVDDFRDPSN